MAFVPLAMAWPAGDYRRMAAILHRREYCPDPVELLDRFVRRRDILLLTDDGGLPGELEALQRGISYLRGRVPSQSVESSA